MRFPFVSPTLLLFALPTLLAPTVSAGTKSYTLNIRNAHIAPDGFYRSASVANGTFPGPLLSATKGDTMQVTVNNKLSDPRMRRSTSIHWHGILQTHNAYNDGSSFVTQCPISPDHSYTYSVNIGQQAGTYWYHSHLSTQYVDGIRGPLVIYPQDPHADLYDVDDESTIITLADWYHRYAPELEAEYLSPNNTHSTDPRPDCGTINGAGRYKGGPETPRSVIRVQKGKRYRFRIINASAMGIFRFSIENHAFTVIEADGVNIVPYPANYLEISPGQRYSIVMHASRHVANYWVRAPLINGGDDNPNLNAEDVFAILRYSGAHRAEPRTHPGHASGTKLQEESIVPLINPGAPGLPKPGGADKVFNLTLSVQGGNPTAHTGVMWKVNGQSYHSPSVPTLLKVLSGASTDADFDPSENSFVIGSGEVVEINISGSNHPHPFHLHGHTFDVVQLNGVTNYVNPPRRDVVTTGHGTTTIRFQADNPAPWIFQCQNEWHMAAGLAVVFVEDPEGERSGPDAIQPSLAWENLCPIYNALPPQLQ